MRLLMKRLTQTALVACAASVLAGCDPPSQAITPSQVTGAIEIKRLFPTCQVTVKIHNGTTYHLNHAGFGLTGYDDVLSVKDIIAGGDDSATLNIPVGYQDSCLAIARKIEATATDNRVGTCSMDGATEGECQHLFAFHSAIDEHAIQGDIDRLKSGNLKVGDAVPLRDSDGRSIGVATNIGGDTAAGCPDNSLPTWQPEAQDIHRDGDGVADSYQISGACPNGGTVQGWVARQEANP